MTVGRNAVGGRAAWLCGAALSTLSTAHAVLVNNAQAAHTQQDLDEVHVAYATTKDGFPGLFHSMLSLTHALPRGEQCTVHIIVKESELALVKEVVECFQREVSGLPAEPKVEVVKMLELPWDTSLMRTTKEGQERSWGRQDTLSVPTVFARFFLDSLLPTLPRVMWLDVDTIVHANVGDLYRMPMSHPVAARVVKYQTTVRKTFDGWSCVDHLSPGRAYDYFNTGVMVLDLEKWRATDYTTQLHKMAAACYCAMQPAFNLIFMDNIDEIDKSWNMISLGSTVKAQPRSDGNILHWSGPTKPWTELPKCHVPGARANDTDCLSADNYADYSAYDPRQECTALPPNPPA